MSADKDDDAELARVVALIDDSRKQPDDAGLQTHALQESLAYLTKLTPAAHLFCHDRRQTVTMTALQVFAFPPSPELAWLKKAAQKHLQSCFLCIKAYHRSKPPMRKTLLDQGFDKDSIDEFMGLLNAYDIERLLASLQPSALKCTAALAANPAKAVPGEAVSDSFPALYEVLYAPNLLHVSAELATAFKTVFLGLQVGGRFLRLSKEIVPAMISFLFCPDPQLAKWAEKSMVQLTKKVVESDFDACVQRAYHEDVVDPYILSSRGQADVDRFWNSMTTLLRAFDRSVIARHCCGGDREYAAADDSIVRLLWADLQAFPVCISTLLPAFAAELQVLGPAFWQFSAPFIPVSLPDLVLGQHCAIAFESALRSEKSTPELLSWVRPFLLSLSGPSRLKCCDILASHFLNRFQDPVKFKSAGLKKVLLQTGFEILIVLLSQDAQFGQVDRIMRREARKVVDKYADLVLRHAADHDKAALSVLESCIATDTDGATDESEAMTSEILSAAMLKPKDITSASIASAESEVVGEQDDDKVFWSECIREDDFVIAKAVISSIGRSRVHLAETIDLIRVSSDAAGAVASTNVSTKLIALRVQKHLGANQRIANVLTAAADALRRISDFSAPRLKEMLLQDWNIVDALLGLSLSAHAGLSRYSLEIIKVAFEASGRMECLQGLFAANPSALLDAYVSTLGRSAVSSQLGLGAVPKLVRTTMDMAALLFDSRTGYVAMHNSTIPDAGVRSTARAFWNSVWRSLTLIFKRTLTWARAYSKDIMVDYMRDVLDLCDNMFSNLQLLEQALGTTDLAQISPTRVDGSLLRTLIEPLREMCPWLRLSDTALLQVCVRLVCGFLNAMSRAQVTVPEEILRRLDKLARPSDSLKNLTDGQCYDLIVALSCFDGDSSCSPEPVKPELIKAEREPKTEVKPEPVRKMKDTKLDAFLKKQVGPTSDAQPAKQIDISSDEEPPVREIKRAKPTLLDTRRQEIQKARQADVVHPPRPPGFRVREPVRDTSAHVSDSDESESEVDSLFALAKHNRPAPKAVAAALLPPQPLRVAAPRRNNQFASRPVLSEKERAERNMRARLRVNIEPLYQRILRWDYHSTTELPSDETDMSRYRSVPNRFTTAAEYKAVFEPLLMLECVQSILKSKEENTRPFRVSITNRVSCDDYIELYASIESNVLSNIGLSDMDVIVLTYVPEDQDVQAGGVVAGSTKQARMPDKRYVSCLAKVKEIKRSSQPDLHDLCLRCLPRPDMARNLLPRAELNALRVMSMTTIEREYSSLQALPYYDLLDYILQARPINAVRADAQNIKRTQRLYDVNAPQAGAILATMESTGFTLIQGPPGTGKTKTILGIIGATLTTTKSRGIPIAMPGQAQKQVPAAVEHKRVLVCAPSNAAVDELVLRLKAGIRNSSGEVFVPKIVRFGRSDIINPAVRSLTLEEQVELEVSKLESNVEVDRTKLREQLNAVLAERAEVDKLIAATDDQAARDRLRTKRDAINAKKAALGQRLDEARDRHAVAVRTNEIERRNIQTRILTSAEVVCATLSGAGHDMLASLALTFETVIIDEAAQCVELSALIPLKYGCIRCAMVGDPNQLPPTVLSQTASRFNYEQSLFVRMQKNYPSAVHLLSIQYRMHPAISSFPSKQFYDSRLIDGDGMHDRTKAEWHAADVFGPYRFVDVDSREQQSKTHSYYNRAEASIALAMYRKLVDAYPNTDFDGKIGIVTPYKQQLVELRNTFRSALGVSGMVGIDFNTVDGFQGQEKEIIILSCVRADPSGKGVGFLADVRRMNVALTRAKSSLWIIGNSQSLVANDVWRALIEDAKHRGVYTPSQSQALSAQNQDGKAHANRKRPHTEQGPQPKRPHASEQPRHVQNKQAQGNGKSHKPLRKPERDHNDNRARNQGPGR